MLVSQSKNNRKQKQMNSLLEYEPDFTSYSWKTNFTFPQACQPLKSLMWMQQI